jgi:hypothetical protein
MQRRQNGSGYGIENTPHTNTRQNVQRMIYKPKTRMVCNERTTEIENVTHHHLKVIASRHQESLYLQEHRCRIPRQSSTPHWHRGLLAACNSSSDIREVRSQLQLVSVAFYACTVMKPCCWDKAYTCSWGSKDVQQSRYQLNSSYCISAHMRTTSASSHALWRWRHNRTCRRRTCNVSTTAYVAYMHIAPNRMATHKHPR